MIYLASPYTHPDAKVRERRYRDVCIYAASMMADGYMIFSPIAHTHGICIAGGERKVGFEFWRLYDEHMMDLADELWVLQLPGWEDSVGVQYEIEYMTKLKKPVIYI